MQYWVIVKTLAIKKILLCFHYLLAYPFRDITYSTYKFWITYVLFYLLIWALVNRYIRRYKTGIHQLGNCSTLENIWGLWKVFCWSYRFTVEFIRNFVLNLDDLKLLNYIKLSTLYRSFAVTLKYTVHQVNVDPQENILEFEINVMLRTCTPPKPGTSSAIAFFIIISLWH